MPVESYQIPGGARVLLFTCEVCGGQAWFGVGVSIRAAIARKDVTEAGAWFCGLSSAGVPCCAASGRLDDAGGALQGGADVIEAPAVAARVPELPIVGGLSLDERLEGAPGLDLGAEHDTRTHGDGGGEGVDAAGGVGGHGGESSPHAVPLLVPRPRAVDNAGQGELAL